MKTRILAGVTAAILLLLLVCFGSFAMIAAVIVFFAGVAYVEFDRLFFVNPSMARQARGVLLVILTILVAGYRLNSLWMAVFFTFVIECVVHVFWLARIGDAEAAVDHMSRTFLGYVYVVSLFGFLLPIVRLGEDGRNYLLLLFFVVFLGDTAAYFVGRVFGKHLLAPLVSPKKTIEGAVGAIVASILISAVWLFFLSKHEKTPVFIAQVLLFAPIGSVLAQLGDLFESLLKRSQAKKDSGSFLPGHGGILDRIDGWALAAPVFYFFLVAVLDR